jgi:hypothetical protein
VLEAFCHNGLFTYATTITDRSYAVHRSSTLAGLCRDQELHCVVTNPSIDELNPGRSIQASAYPSLRLGPSTGSGRHSVQPRRTQANAQATVWLSEARLLLLRDPIENIVLDLVDAIIGSGNHVVPGVGVCVGNDVGEGLGVGVTRRDVTSDPAILNAILRTTSKLMTQATTRFRCSVERRTIPPLITCRR